MKSSETCVMLRVSAPWQSVARYSGPLNRDLLLSTSHSFLPSIPSSFHSLPLSFTSRNSPAPFPFFFLLLLLPLSSFCSFVPLWHIPQAQRAQGETEQERMAREVKQKEGSEGGKVSERGQRQERRSFFISLSRKRGWGEWVSREIKGKQRVTEMERQRCSQVKTDSSLLGKIF